MSRFTKETFPEKWCIEHHDIVYHYFKTNNPGYTYSRGHIWYHSSNLNLGSGWISHIGPDVNHTIITLEEFKEFVLMEKQFKVPEKWWVKVTTKKEDEILTDYCNNKFNTTTGGVSSDPGQPIFYYSEKIGGICWTVGTNRADESFTEITYDQFVKYVLNEQSTFENHSQLIKLLNDAL